MEDNFNTNNYYAFIGKIFNCFIILIILCQRSLTLSIVEDEDSVAQPRDWRKQSPRPFQGQTSTATPPMASLPRSKSLGLMEATRTSSGRREERTLRTTTPKSKTSWRAHNDLHPFQIWASKNESVTLNQWVSLENQWYSYLHLNSIYRAIRTSGCGKSEIQNGLSKIILSIKNSWLSYSKLIREFNTDHDQSKSSSSKSIICIFLLLLACFSFSASSSSIRS